MNLLAADHEPGNFSQWGTSPGSWIYPPGADRTAAEGIHTIVDGFGGRSGKVYKAERVAAYNARIPATAPSTTWGVRANLGSLKPMLYGAFWIYPMHDAVNSSDVNMISPVLCFTNGSLPIGPTDDWAPGRGLTIAVGPAGIASAPEASISFQKWYTGTLKNDYWPVGAVDRTLQIPWETWTKVVWSLEWMAGDWVRGQLRLGDCTIEVDVTGDDANFCDGWSHVHTGARGTTYYLDDVAINDSSGTTLNTYPCTEEGDPFAGGGSGSGSDLVTEDVESVVSEMLPKHKGLELPHVIKPDMDEAALRLAIQQNFDAISGWSRQFTKGA